MKKASLLITIIVAVLVTACPKKPETRQFREPDDVYTTVRIKKSGYVDNFPQSSPGMRTEHVQAAKEIAEYMKAHPQAILFLKGSISTEKVIRKHCYATVNYTYFSISHPRKGVVKITDEAQCAAVLGIVRAMNLKRAIESHQISFERIKCFAEVDYNSREGDPGLNQAVSYWYLEVQEGSKLVSAKEDSRGDLVSVILPPLLYRR